MTKNMAVTRTISAGAISNSDKVVHSDDFLTARRHSSAGMRALLWATSGAHSLGSSFRSELQTSRENIFTNILTPDSIPQFTIPNLSVQAILKSSELIRDRQSEEDDAETDEGVGSLGTESLSVLPTSSTLSSSTSLSASSSSPLDRRAQRSTSDPLTQRRSLCQREGSLPCPYTEAQHCFDPASRAALSLPHLAKVTTPYGFVTLSQSPQMASEEALLNQAGQRRLKKDEETACFHSKVTRTSAINIESDSSHRSTARQRSSKDLTHSQAEGKLSKVVTQNATASFVNTSASTSSTAKQATKSKPKPQFYEVIRKHFISRH